MKPLVLLSLFLVLGTSWGYAQEKILIVTPGYDHPMALVAAKILPEAFQAAGAEAEFKVLPPSRADRAFDAGEVGAWIFADASFAAKHPGAVQVVPSIGSDDIVVFSKRTDLKVAGWPSLKGYSVGYNLGMVVVENGLKGVAGLKVDPAQDPPSVFKKLDAGRSDLAVMPRGVGLMMIKALNLQGIQALSPALERVPLYVFLTAKNAALAPKLTKALDEILRSGRLKAVTAEVEATFTNR